MKLPRRQFLHLAASAAALPAVPRIARAQAYPTRPVHLIVPIAPAGGGDILARLMGQWLSERLGQQFIVDTRTNPRRSLFFEVPIRSSHYPVCPKPAITLSRKDWHSSANGAVV